MYEFIANQTIVDAVTGKVHLPGEKFTALADRLPKLLNYAKVVKFYGPKKRGAKILVIQSLEYKIGGIETFNINFAKKFKDKNITFVFESADFLQASLLSQYAEVIIDDKVSTYDCDVLIVQNYDVYERFKERVKARKRYQMLHANWEELTQHPAWRNFTWAPSPDIDRVLAVSQSCADANKRVFGIESVVAPNILVEPDDTMVFICLSRATQEKGIDKLFTFVEQARALNRPFVVFLASSLEGAQTTSGYPEIVNFAPTPLTKPILKSADYLIQLSSSESYCYSVHEALQQGVPCIVSDVSALTTVIQSGHNGYILKENFTAEDLKPIFTKKPIFTPIKEEFDPVWNDIIAGNI